MNTCELFWCGGELAFTHSAAGSDYYRCARCNTQHECAPGTGDPAIPEVRRRQIERQRMAPVRGGGRAWGS